MLARLGLPFEVCAPDIDESPAKASGPWIPAMRLSEGKARAVAARYTDALVIGSDQVADCDGRAVSKPGDRANAQRELRALSGRAIVFHTGVALVDAASGRCQRAMVDVVSVFRTLTDAEINEYLDRESPYDCAGGVKSEALGIALFERITSDDPTALVGLPLITLCRMLRAGRRGSAVVKARSTSCPTCWASYRRRTSCRCERSQSRARSRTGSSRPRSPHARSSSRSRTSARSPIFPSRPSTITPRLHG
jgi:septum formation protein